MDEIKKQLIARMLPMMLEIALENFGELEKVLMEQASRTDTEIDDFMVGIFLSWAKGWLQDQVK